MLPLNNCCWAWRPLATLLTGGDKFVLDGNNVQLLALLVPGFSTLKSLAMQLLITPQQQIGSADIVYNSGNGNLPYKLQNGSARVCGRRSIKLH